MTAVTGMAVSCTVTEITPVEQAVPITYQAVVGSRDTRLIEGNIYESTAPSFGSSAFILPEGRRWADSRTSAELYINKKEVTYQGDGWTTATQYHWPHTGRLTFFAFSPWEDVNLVTTVDRTDGVTIRDWNVNGENGENQKHDIMVATVAADKNENIPHSTPVNNYNGVETVFHHKLAVIDAFSFKHDGQAYIQTPGTTTKGDIEFFVKKVCINNVTINGTYKSGHSISNSGTDSGRWIAATEPQKYSYVWYEMKDGDSPLILTGEEREIVGGRGDNIFPTLKRNGYLLVIPQTFTAPANALPHESEAYIEIIYAARFYIEDGNSDDYFEETLTRYIPLHDLHSDNGNKWEMNKRYSYTVTVSLGRISCVPEVAQWGTVASVAP